MLQLEFQFMHKPALRARIDISKVSDADEVELGDIVCIVVKGKVTSLRGPDKYLSQPFSESGKKGKETENVMPGSIELEVQSMKVQSEEDFSGMAEEDE